MFYDQSKTTVNINLSIENDIEVDADGNCQLVTLLFNDFEDAPYETRVRFEDVIDNLVDFYRDLSTPNGGINQLLAIANEFERHAHDLKDIADQMQGYGPSFYDEDYRQLDLFDDMAD